MLILPYLTSFSQEEPGNLVIIDAEYVYPEHYNEYIQWGKEFKAFAEKTDFQPFFVSSSGATYSYIWGVGNDLASVDAFDKKFVDWANTNPELNEMYRKYKHTISHRTREIWRYSHEYSYFPDGADQFIPTYQRIYVGKIKFGHTEEIVKLLEDFKNTWKEAGVSTGYNVYWGVMGVDDPSVAFVSSYPSREAWAKESDEIEAKVGEKLGKLLSSWNSHIREWEQTEGFPNMELSHMDGN